MAKFLYLPTVIVEAGLNNTFFHFSYRGSSWKLRDYSEGFENVVLGSSRSNYTVENMRHMAKHDIEVGIRRKRTDVRFWKQEIDRLNKKYLDSSEENRQESEIHDFSTSCEMEFPKEGSCRVLGYSERGIVTALLYEIGKSKRCNQLLMKLLKQAQFPHMDRSAFDILASEILIEQSFSHFGDADLVLLLRTSNRNVTIFAEAKVKPSQSYRWEIKDEFERFLAGTKAKLSSSNLFTQFYHKMRMVNALAGDGLAELKAGVPFPTCSSRPLRRIGNNPVVLKAVKKIHNHMKLENVYFLMIIPDTKSNLENFFNNELQRIVPPNLPEWHVKAIGYLTWSVVKRFCVDNRLEGSLSVFNFNEGQIF